MVNARHDDGDVVHHEAHHGVNHDVNRSFLMVRCFTGGGFRECLYACLAKIFTRVFIGMFVKNLTRLLRTKRSKNILSLVSMNRKINIPVNE